MSTPFRELPAHLAQRLGAAGGMADGAGQPWAGRDLEGQHHRFTADDGAPDAAYRKSVAELCAGRGSEAAVVASLAQARVFVPIIATDTSDPATNAEHAHPDHSHGDKESEMALVTVKAPDGRIALPVFSSPERLTQWHSQARPVPVYAPRAALSAVAEGAQLLVIDPGTETVVVRRPAVWALAQQREWVPSYADPVVEEEVRRVVGGLWDGRNNAASLARIPENRPRVPGVESVEPFDRLAEVPQANPMSWLHGVTIQAGSGIRTVFPEGVTVAGGGSGPELNVIVHLVSGLDHHQVNSVVSALQQALAQSEVFAERVDSLQISLRGTQEQLP
ncbi:SseB family protein [Psychromicrobium xiongbiense]|uniref:SseB family protein n=1 Tax=Psychromicrobium xiongbiense TaxID=3051184 RepID=UPI002554BE1F|nr:SseB family protein [Psychromicrobium sp. YIM S02556]